MKDKRKIILEDLNEYKLNDDEIIDMRLIIEAINLLIEKLNKNLEELEIDDIRRLKKIKEMIESELSDSKR